MWRIEVIHNLVPLANNVKVYEHQVPDIRFVVYFLIKEYRMQYLFRELGLKLVK